MPCIHSNNLLNFYDIKCSVFHRINEDVGLYYFNTKTKESSWTHPLDTHVKARVIKERTRTASAATGNIFNLILVKRGVRM